MHRWANCPASFRLIAEVGDKIPPRRSIHAARGTVAHMLIEQALKQLNAKLDPQLHGMVITQDGHEIEVDDTMVDGVNEMLNYVARRAGDLRVEHRVSLDGYLIDRGIKPPVPLFATTDVQLLFPVTHSLEIVDYKNGAGVVVDVRDNPQLMYYAAGSLADVKTRIDRVTITVVQPNTLGHDKIRQQTLATLDVLMWVDDVLIPAVQDCMDPQAPFVPGSWCRWCPVAQACPALAADANKMAARDFAEHMLPETVEELAAALDIAERAERWIDAVRSYALERAKAQEHIPGWGLEPTRPVRRWTDSELVLNTLVAKGFNPVQLIKQEPMTPAQMEKALRNKVARDWWLKTKEPLIERHSSGVKLTRTGDDPSLVLADGDEP